MSKKNKKFENNNKSEYITNFSVLTDPYERKSPDICSFFSIFIYLLFRYKIL